MKLFLKFSGLLMVLFTAFVSIRFLLTSDYIVLNIMGGLIGLTAFLLFLFTVHLLREELKTIFGDKPSVESYE
jgi:hypothetical protein